MSKKKEPLKPALMFKEAVLDKNPVLGQLLGMCSTLAVTTSVENSLGMGAATSVVLICSNIFISLLRNFIPKQIRIASYIVIISGFVTAVQFIMQAFFEGLYESLGLFIPLIVVNCIILGRAEAFASKNNVGYAALDGIFMGVGFTRVCARNTRKRYVLRNEWFRRQVRACHNDCPGSRCVYSARMSDCSYELFSC